MAKVTLISSTADAVYTCGYAAANCTGAEDISRALNSALESGHDSVLEHASVTFEIQGVSRACAAQLERHRLASYAERSYRYSVVPNERVMPSTLVSFEEDYRRVCESAYTLYRRMISEHVPPEDARYVLPLAWTTDIVVTMNLRELKHFIALRTCNRAQSEIRDVAGQMAFLLERIYPRLNVKWGPQCVRLGHCPEKRGCGRRADGVDQ